MRTGAILTIGTLAIILGQVSILAVIKPPKGVTGQIQGKPFHMGEARLKKLGFNTASSGKKIEDRAQAYILELREGSEFFANREFDIFLGIDPGRGLAGRTLVSKPYVFSSDEYRKQLYGSHSGSRVGRGITAVHCNVRGCPTEMYSDRINCTVSFGKASNGFIDGTIRLILPGKNDASGWFRAKLEDLRSRTRTGM